MDTGSTAFYAGSATPSTAPFHVTTAGVLSASGATISGSSTFSGSLSGATGTFSGGITASSLSITGTASFSGGSMTLPNGGSITSSTVDLNQGTIAGMTVDGTLTVSSASGGKVVLNSGGSFGDVIKFQNAGTDKASIYVDSTNAYFARNTGAQVYLSDSVAVMQGPSGSYGVSFSNSVVDIFGGGHAHVFDSSGRFIAGGNVFPQGQTSYYIGSNGSRLDLAGPVNFANHTVGGSTANWSSAGPATSYITVQIAGVNRRIPFYADA